MKAKSYRYIPHTFEEIRKGANLFTWTIPPGHVPDKHEPAYMLFVGNPTHLQPDSVRVVNGDTLIANWEAVESFPMQGIVFGVFLLP